MQYYVIDIKINPKVNMIPVAESGVIFTGGYGNELSAVAIYLQNCNMYYLLLTDTHPQSPNDALTRTRERRVELGVHLSFTVRGVCRNLTPKRIVFSADFISFPFLPGGGGARPIQALHNRIGQNEVLIISLANHQNALLAIGFIENETSIVAVQQLIIHSVYD